MADTPAAGICLSSFSDDRLSIRPTSIFLEKDYFRGEKPFAFSCGTGCYPDVPSESDKIMKRQSHRLFGAPTTFKKNEVVPIEASNE
ncbi:hypothetical protein [Herbaspirillum lusitanum]|uniref:hypothetical protein n=1 Tax=Herbaspirillum lusitanum TaxID=213312 RepID=UPI0012F4EFE8|nr:hypothetical protein [Herbaspirillum lusitanum]